MVKRKCFHIIIIIIIIITLFESQIILAEHECCTNWGDCKSNKSNQIKCWFLRRGENRSSRRKTSRSRVENQQTQPIYDAGSGNRTRDTLVEGECSHHYTNPGNRGGNTELEWATLPITIQNLFNLESAMTLYVQKNSWLVLKSTFHWKTNRRKSNFLNCHSLKILIFFCLFFTLKVYFNTLKDHVMYLSVDISSSKWHFQKHSFREW